MENLYSEIGARTGGNIYIGVVGPVRSGKSTLIKRFMETMVIPYMEDGKMKQRAIDELPQSSAGKTIMTTEPKFIPEEAVPIHLDQGSIANVRMIDCVGYILPGSIGFIENNAPRMVATPWFDREIPFNMAAEIGTRKVMTDHSTIGLVVTSDGSITDINWQEYKECETRIIDELREIHKPFAVIINSTNPAREEVQMHKKKLEEKYRVPVLAVNCLSLDMDSINEILSSLLYEFPVEEVGIHIPAWVMQLDNDHWLRRSIFSDIKNESHSIEKMRDIEKFSSEIVKNENISRVDIKSMNLGLGSAAVNIEPNDDLFYKILGEATGIDICDESGLIPCMRELAAMKKEYEKIKGALEEVAATGYGIVMPTIDELALEEPEIVKQGGKYGVKLKASAPSLHILRADITTEVSPIVGSEKQSEELVGYLLKEFEENPGEIWQSNIFGKSLHELVNEGLHNKLLRMPSDARMKMQETIERVINEGCSGLICIII